MPKNKEQLRLMVQRMEKAGFHAIAVTCDSNIHGKRDRNERNGFTKPPHISFAVLEKSI